MANQTRLFFLLDQYAQKKYTAGEKRELFLLLADPGNEKLVKQWIDNAFHNQLPDASMDDAAQEDMIQAIVTQLPSQRDEHQVVPLYPQPRTPGIPWIRRRWTRYAVASMVILAAGWIYFKKPNSGNKSAVVARVLAQAEPAPGAANAVLTLGTGKKLTLDAKATETLKDLGIRNSANVIQYPDAGAAELNTLSTPRGGQYQIILSDDTKVWLNAASSITYPTVFVGKLRPVSITGEVYFEVSKNAEKPFEVSLENGSRIEVLGTHFNVNAYRDEPVATTTLLEGSIRINNAIVKPGESYSNGQITKADISSVMAWKNGYFQLKGISTEALMRQFSRWYDVDVSFEGPVTERKFAGQLQRSLKLPEAIRILEESNIHFRREGNKVIVLNK